MDFEGTFNEFMGRMRQEAVLRSGAVIFGGAVGAYHKALIEAGFSDDQALGLTVDTTQTLIKAIAQIIPPLAEVTLKAAELWQQMQATAGQKEVPS